MKKLKKAWRSKTVWFNALALSLMSLADMLQAALPQLHEFLPENAYKTMGWILIIGNVVLRFVTSKPLESK